MRIVHRSSLALLTAVAVLLSASAVLVPLGAHAAAADPATVPAGTVLDVDFGSGAATDVAQGLTATTHGAPSVADDTALGQKVARFDGSADAYAYPFADQWSRLAGGFSVECELRYDGPALPTGTTTQGLCSNAQSGGADLQVTGGRLAFAVNVGGYKYVYADIDPGTWYDVVATWDGHAVALYLDGRLVSSTAAAGSLTVPSSGAQNWTLGADSAPSGGVETPAPVSLAHAQVWDTVLSADQAAALAAQRGLTATAPAADVLDVDLAGGTATDRAQGLAVTTSGAPTFARDAVLGRTVASFDGSDDAFQYPMSAQWGKLTNGFSVECELRYDGPALPTATQGLCSNAQSGGADLQVVSGELAFSVYVAGAYRYAYAPLTPGTWHDVVGSWDGNSVTLAVDGVLVATTPAAGSLGAPAAAAQKWTLGADSSASGGIETPARVSLGVARIWSKALTSDQVAALAAQQVSASPTPTPTPTGTPTPTPTPTGTPTPTPTPTTTAAPTPDVLDVDFAGGKPTDYAQSLPVTVKGAPKIAADATLGTDVATFDGAADAYTYPFAAQWSKLSAGFSVACTFRWNGASIPTTGQKAICSNAQSGGADLQIDSGQLAFSVNVGGYKYTHAPIVPGTWYHAVATWDGHDVRLYVDGTLVSTTAAAGTLTAPAAGAQNWTLGADSATGGGIETPSPVSLGSARVWSTALSGDQVAALAVQDAEPPTTATAPDVLNVDFADGTPADHAQALTATTWGAPKVAHDDTAGKEVASFDGTDDAYSYPFSDQWPKLTHGITLECRVRYDGTSLPTGSATAGFCSDVYAGGAIVEAVYGGVAFAVDVDGTYVFATAPAERDTWYDLVGTWDGQKADLYVDGVLVSSVPAAGTFTVPQADAQSFVLGANAGSGDGLRTPAQVTIASAQVWSTALSARQVAALGGHTVRVTSTGKGSATASTDTSSAFQTVALVATPTPGYHFTGWTSTPAVTVGEDGTFLMPASDVSLQATFAPNDYTVHYDANGGTGRMADTSLVYDQSAALAANGFTRDGQLFAGWATSPDAAPSYADRATVSDLTAADEITLYAAWYPVGSHRVTVAGDGHGSATASPWAAAPGDAVTLTTKPDSGYHFDAWSDPSPADLTIDARGTFTMPDADVSVHAGFAPNTYTVRYAGNGSDAGATADSTLSFGQKGALAPNGFEKDGYVFAGWGTAPDGPVVYADTAVVSDLSTTDGATVTLYAQWREAVVAAGSWPSLPAGFVTDTFYLPGVATGTEVSQPLVGLWNGAAPTSFTRVDGDSWLTVSASGVVSGTAPGTVPQNAGAITVAATRGTVTSQILVEVPVHAADDAQEVQAASWNLWDAGSHVTDALGKDLAIVAAQGIGVIGVQDDNGTTAQALATALGWHSRAAGRLGIVSAWPISEADLVRPTAAAPAMAATITVAGQAVRIWDAQLDEGDYGPYRACRDHATDLAAHERTTTRYAQAQAVAQEMADDLAGSAPVVLLGDLASPSSTDWTAATSDAHCDAGDVDWPVPDVFAGAGLTDSYRVANPDPATDPGDTWSPITPTSADGSPEPQDRVDYVDVAGSALHVEEAHALTVGWPSATDPADNSWPSDHAAAVTTFTLGESHAATPPAAPVVSVTRRTIAYQVGHGPADDAAFLGDVGAVADGADGADGADATVAVDLHDVDFATAGWYTALVTATRDGYTSVPVAVTVRVAPVPGLTLSQATASFDVGGTVTEAAVLARLEPQLDVAGVVHVDLSHVNAWVPGTYPATVTATDVWGFAVTQAATVSVVGTADTTPPVVVTTVTPGAPDGRSGWYVTAPTVTARATDDDGVAPALESRLGDGGWTSYTGALTPPDGASTYAVRATDRAGNVGTASVTVHVDTTAPVTTSTVVPGVGRNAPVLVTLTAADAASGVASTQYRVADGDWTPYVASFTVARTERPTAVSYRSVDVAGNVEEVGQVVVPARQTVTPTIAVSAPPTVYGVAATVTVTVTADGPATGTVTIAEGTTPRGSAVLSGGSAQLTLPVGLAVGSHVLTVAYSGDETVDPATGSVTLTVGLPDAWRSASVYQAGDRVGFQGRLYVASWWTQNQVPGDPNGPWQEISMTEDGAAVWTASRVFEAGDTAVYRGTTYRAGWYTRNQVPGDPYGPWSALG